MTADGYKNTIKGGLGNDSSCIKIIKIFVRIFLFIFHSIARLKENKIVNDPLGQTHSPDHYFQATFVMRYFEKWGTDVRTKTSAKIIITTGQDFGAAEWINKP